MIHQNFKCIQIQKPVSPHMISPEHPFSLSMEVVYMYDLSFFVKLDTDQL